MKENISYLTRSAPSGGDSNQRFETHILNETFKFSKLNFVKFVITFLILSSVDLSISRHSCTLVWPIMPGMVLYLDRVFRHDNVRFRSQGFLMNLSLRSNWRTKWRHSDYGTVQHLPQCRAIRELGHLSIDLLDPMSIRTQSNRDPKSIRCRSDVDPMSIRCRSAVDPMSIWCWSNVDPVDPLLISCRFYVDPISIRPQSDRDPMSIRCRSDVDPMSIRCWSDVDLSRSCRSWVSRGL